MTIYDDSWVRAEEARRRWLAENGLYRAEDERDACGVGQLAAVAAAEAVAEKDTR